MPIDFSMMEGVQIGYQFKLEFSAHETPAGYVAVQDKLLFTDFIKKYAENANNYQEVYSNLEKEILNKDSSARLFFSMWGFIGVNCIEAYRRDAIMNALELLKENYLIPDAVKYSHDPFFAKLANLDGAGLQDLFFPEDKLNAEMQEEEKLSFVYTYTTKP